MKLESLASFLDLRVQHLRLVYELLVVLLVRVVSKTALVELEGSLLPRMEDKPTSRMLFELTFLHDLPQTTGCQT
eukprot:CAMPEP_0115351956 /NCGR_PEP_ID=MMETSP0270-20121206/97256_1 /TAXON_ID=71861 /ORGANISM="Scrippsiella trochoidea, Strain CCMP3099" /LENGTH=74 /DNA_ID=CAMNT_0002774111 /DNA_START=249 /DNA_END=469 /DNA_ORIENTATION=+